MADVLHDDDPTNDGNLSADEYWARAEQRAREHGPCSHPDITDADLYGDDE